MEEQVKGSVFVILCAVFWGINSVVAQYLFSFSSISTFEVLTIRLIISGAILLFICVRKIGRCVFDIFKNKRDILEISLFSLISILGMQFTFYNAIKASNSTTACILQYIYPVLVMITICYIDKVFPKTIQIVAIFLAVFGSTLIVTHGNTASIAISKAGLLWGLSSAVCMAFYTIRSRKITEKYGTNLVSGWGMLLGGILASFFCINDFSINQINSVSLGCLFVIILFGTILPFRMYLQGVSLIGGVRASAIGSVESLTTASLSTAFFHIFLSVTDIIGIVCILSTVVLPALKVPLWVQKNFKFWYNRIKKKVGRNNGLY